MRYQNQFLILLSLFFLTSCSKTKLVKTKGEDGFTKEYEVDKKSNLKNGTYRLYDQSNNLVEESQYVNDQINGSRTLFYKSGAIESIEQYVNGNFEGTFKGFYEDGVLQQEGNYTNGQMVGKWSSYYENGKLKEVVTFKDNEENGPFIEYYENGVTKAEGSYLNGDNEHGGLVLFKEDGSVERKMNCVEGRCTTIWTSENKTEE